MGSGRDYQPQIGLEQLYVCTDLHVCMANIKSVLQQKALELRSSY